MGSWNLVHSTPKPFSYKQQDPLHLGHSTGKQIRIKGLVTLDAEADQSLTAVEIENADIDDL